MIFRCDNEVQMIYQVSKMMGIEANVKENHLPLHHALALSRSPIRLSLGGHRIRN